MEDDNNKVRINKYLADKGLATRRGADDLIETGKVFVNGLKAVLGQKIGLEDKVEVRGAPSEARRYVAYYKPKGYVTHTPATGEKEIADIFDMEDLFPIGRLDKNSDGLIILTNDGRITDRLLNPKYEHEKEYIVETEREIIDTFKEKLEKGILIGPGEMTKPAKVEILDEHSFSIVITEGKKHQVKRMTEALGISVHDLKRVRIMNIKLDKLSPNKSRKISGKELEKFLGTLGLKS
ncbi:MAG: pseudouridine synthase [bacterium]|nr:pseudouridine synthase [bacterium]